MAAPAEEKKVEKVVEPQVLIPHGPVPTFINYTILVQLDMKALEAKRKELGLTPDKRMPSPYQYPPDECKLEPVSGDLKINDIFDRIFAAAHLDPKAFEILYAKFGRDSPAAKAPCFFRRKNSGFQLMRSDVAPTQNAADLQLKSLMDNPNVYELLSIICRPCA